MTLTRIFNICVWYPCLGLLLEIFVWDLCLRSSFGIFVWDFCLGSLFRIFAWDLCLELCLESFACDLSLGNFRLWTFYWTSAWKLSLGNFRLGTFACELSLVNFRLGTFAWNFRLGELDSCDWGNRWTGAGELTRGNRSWGAHPGEPSGGGARPLPFKMLYKNPLETPKGIPS